MMRNGGRKWENGGPYIVLEGGEGGNHDGNTLFMHGGTSIMRRLICNVSRDGF